MLKSFWVHALNRRFMDLRVRWNVLRWNHLLNNLSLKELKLATSMKSEL